MSASAVASPGVGGDAAALPESISSGLESAFSTSTDTGTGNHADTGDGPAVEEDDIFGSDGDNALDQLNGEGEVDADQPQPEAGAEEAAQQTAATDEAPEGGHIRKRANGRDEWVYTPEKGKRLHEGFVAAREAAEVLGEPLTTELVTSLHGRANANDLLHAHFESGDPELQGGIIDHLMRRGDDALASGEAQVHPMVSFSATLPAQLLKANTEQATQAYLGMRDSIMKDFLPALIEMAQGLPEGDDRNNLTLSAQHLQRHLFGDYSKPKQRQQQDPLAPRRSDLDAREARLREQETSRATEEWNNWTTGSKQSNVKAIDDAIEESLASVAKDYAKLPEKFTELKTRLKAKVIESVKSSREFNARIRTLQDQARIARTSERRGALAEQIASAYRNRAKLTLESVVSKETSEFASTLKTQATAAHERREQAQTRRTPSSTGAQPARTIGGAPKNGAFSDRFAASIEDAFR